jgi:signal transduction histidine kinase/CheY-like chemotaxis protein
MIDSNDQKCLYIPNFTELNVSKEEEERLKEIFKYELLDYEIDDPALLSLNKLAAYICDVPMSNVSIVNLKYCEFISRAPGFNFSNTIREHSFCHYAILQDQFFEVEDTMRDKRFEQNVFVKNQPKPVRYYAAWPVKSPAGCNVGVLLVADFVPRKMSPQQIEALRVLRDQVQIQFIIKMQNKELTALYLKAEKLSKVKDEFISNISHELRTPLNAINGYAHILQKSSLDKDQREAVSIIRNSSEILIPMVNDILDFSKINSQKLVLEKIPFNLRETVLLVYHLLLNKAKEKSLKFELNVDEKIPSKLIGDKIRINQIIMNLASNSLKFTEKGSVSINVKLREETQENVVIDFSVRDTGIGIPEDKIKTIFERFEQAGSEITRKFGGTGLGLNISKNLVQLHGGELKVKSKYGQGSEFYFTIKYEKVSPEFETLEKTKLEIESRKSEFNMSKFKNLRVLICEDNSINIKLIKHYFKNKVSFLGIAENGEKAIEILKNTKFDVILMDIHMPILDGIETTKYIRNTLNLSIPIIGFTNNNSQEEKEMCLSIGMNDYINKTFVSNEIFDKISNVLSLSDKCDNDETSSEKETINNLLKYYSFSPRKISRKKKYIKEKSKFKKSNENFDVKHKKKSLDVQKEKTLKINESSGNESKLNNLLHSGDCRYLNKKTDHINLSILNDFSGDDRVFEKELMQHFLEKFYSDFENLKFNLKEQNYKEIEFFIHKMKSPLGIFGLSNITENLEYIKLLSNKEYLYKLSLEILGNVENNIKIIEQELRDLLESEVYLKT